MEISILISAKANDPRRRYTRRPRARAALAAGAAAVALLGGPAAAAQASAAGHVAAVKAVVKLGSGAVPSGVSCTSTGPLYDQHHGGPLFAYVPGSGNYNLYFDNTGTQTVFCLHVVYFDGIFTGFQFYDTATGLCLALNSTPPGTIHEGSATACKNGNADYLTAPYTVWDPILTSDINYYVYESYYNNECIYDDAQRPATYAACNLSNQFEWLSYPSTPPQLG
jgi:hypothetical protein